MLEKGFDMIYVGVDFLHPKYMQFYSRAYS